MPTKKKPLVIVTRKLPDSVETRMRELFDTRLNLDDKPMSQGELAEAAKSADVLVPTVTDRIDASVLGQAGDKLKLIANFGNGVDNIDVTTALQRGITVTNTPGVLTEDTADMTMALILAVPRRLAEGVGRPHRREGLERMDADLDARPPHLGQAAGHHRHGPDRAGGGPPGARLRPADPLSQSPPGRAADRGGARSDLLGKPRSDAGAHGHPFGQLPAHAGNLPSAVGAAAEAAAAGRLHRQHRARRGDRRECAGADDRGGRACRAPAWTCSSTSRR